MTKKKQRKRSIKRFPLAKVAGALAGIAIASGGSSGFGGNKFTAAIADMTRGDFRTASGRISDAIKNLNPREVGTGVVVAALGSELSKANTRYLGLKFDLPLGIKVRL